MLDRLLRPLIDPPLNASGRFLARLGVSADQITLVGALIGAAAGAAAATGAFLLCLGLVVLNRLFDGLDGAVARATRRSDLGGYLDIVGDYVFYVAVPLGFGLPDPSNLAPALALTASFTLTAATFLAFAAIAAASVLRAAVPPGSGRPDPWNVPAALVLTASFTLTAATFLAFAAIAAQRGERTSAYGPKSFFYSVGLAEGAETIAAFVAMCLFPAAFPIIAFAFAGLCALTVVQRSILARLTFTSAGGL